MSNSITNHVPVMPSWKEQKAKHTEYYACVRRPRVALALAEEQALA